MNPYNLLALASKRRPTWNSKLWANSFSYSEWMCRWITFSYLISFPFMSFPFTFVSLLVFSLLCIFIFSISFFTTAARFKYVDYIQRLPLSIREVASLCRILDLKNFWTTCIGGVSTSPIQVVQKIFYCYLRQWKMYTWNCLTFSQILFLLLSFV